MSLNHVPLTLGPSLEKCVLACLKQKLPAMIRGRHGIGKSEWIYQLAKRITWVKDCPEGLPVVEVRLSQMSEGDIIGMPSQKPKKIGMLEAMSFNAPDWFAKACTEPCVLFFDELDRANREVRQGTFQISDSRRIHGNPLHPDTVILAAINGGPSGDDYQVQELDKAENSRWQIFDVVPDFQIWKRWAEGQNYNKALIDFLTANHDALFAPKTDPNLPPWTVQPNPRQWSRLHSILKDMNLFDRETALGSTETVLALFGSAVGTNAGQKYIKFQQDRVSFSLLDAIKKPELLEDYFKKSKQADVVEKVTEILDEIHNSESWIWSFDPCEVYTSGPRKGAIKASFFMDALYLGMKDNAELCLPYIYSMIMGIQLQVLEKIKAEYQDNERKAKIDELQMRLKCIFGSFVENLEDKTQFLTAKNFKDKKYMMDHHFSYDSRICEFVRDEVSKAEGKIQEFIDSKAKKES